MHQLPGILWPVSTVAEIAAEKRSAIAIGPFGSRMKADSYSDGGVPVIRGTNLVGGREFGGEFVFVPEEKADELEGANVFPGDLVFPHRGAIGEVGVVPSGSNVRWMLSTSLMKLSCDPAKADSLFLYYYFRSKWGRHELLRHASTVGTPGIGQPLTSLRSVRVAVPSLLEQRGIAAVLGVLDDKIELNRRMNRALEEMAQAIFQSWFVDFDGQTEFEDSGTELGEIPVGWSVEPIGQVVNAVGGSTPSTKVDEYWEGGTIHWTTPKDLSSLSSPVLLDTERKITEAGLSKISSGLLPIGTVLMSSRAPVGYLAIAQVAIAVNQGYIAIPPGDRLGSLYVLHWLKANMERIKARAGGTTFQEISKRSFRPILVLVPPQEQVRHFDAVTGSLFERIVGNETQSRTLAELRDTLLPKLISGEIRVPQAESSVESAL